MEASLDQRRVGEYGHYVVPLTQLAHDAEELVGAALQPHLAETRAIARESQGVHPEEAATLYMLVRALRPKLVLETGTFKGYSTAEIARALMRNGEGRLVTVDVAAQTGEQVPDELRPLVTFHRETASREFADGLAAGTRVDLFFHDSLHTYLNTLGELIWFAPHYAPDAVIVCHDAKMDYTEEFGVGRAVRLFATRLGLAYRVLDTTCGLALIRWRADVPADRLQALREEHEAMQKRAAEGTLRRAVRRLLKV